MSSAEGNVATVKLKVVESFVIKFCLSLALDTPNVEYWSCYSSNFYVISWHGRPDEPTKFMPIAFSLLYKFLTSRAAELRSEAHNRPAKIFTCINSYSGFSKDQIRLIPTLVELDSEGLLP